MHGSRAGLFADASDRASLAGSRARATALKRHTLRIASRFHGPPGSGNGGYVCGRVAAHIDGPASVRLRVPPPLEVDLELRCGDTGVALFHGDTPVAEGRAATLSIDPPKPPSHAHAEAAARSYRGFARHPYPSCFVCGPQREVGDGMRIFAGPVAGRALVAAPWLPDASLATEDGALRPEFLWAALDCPGGFTFASPAHGSILLGELTAALLGTVRVGEPCVVTGWEIAHEGRKHHTGTALFGADGGCRGFARGTWLEVPAAPGAGFDARPQESGRPVSGRR
jgi:hypothetical protein